MSSSGAGLSAAERAALNVSYTPLVKNSIAFLGDSLMENGGENAVYGPNREASGAFWPWALDLLDQRLTLAGNYGVAGQQSGAILARVNDSLVNSPGWVHVLAGTNDVLGGNSAASCIANLGAIYDTLASSGARVIIGTVPPANGWTAPQILVYSAINDYIRAQSYARKGFVLADYAAALTDPITGIFGAGLSADGTHPTPLGGFRGGRVLADALRPHLPPATMLDTGITAGAKNLLGISGRFKGGTGDASSGWKYQGFTVAPTLTQPQRTDNVLGNWNEYAVPNGDRVEILVNVPIDANLSIGDTVEFFAEYQVDTLDPAPAANTTGFSLTVQCYDGVGMTSKARDLRWAAGSANHPVIARSGVFRAPPLLIPAGTTLVQCFIDCRGGGKYRFDRAVLRKV